MKKKIILFEVQDWEREWLTRNLGGFELKFNDWAVQNGQVPAVGRDANAISIAGKSVVSEEILDLFPNLEMIAVRARYCSGLDLAACRRRKVLVSSLPKLGEHAVAEFTFALILSLSRKLTEAIKRGQEGNNSSDGLRGFDLFGKTIGVLGTGLIGSEVIRIAKGFGMKILAWSAKQDLRMAQEMGFVYVPLEMLMAHSDVITLHLPYVTSDKPSSTNHLIGRKYLSICKRGALFINTSHEGLVDTSALVEALRQGVVGGAALDAYDRTYHRELSEMYEVKLTPQTAFNTTESREDVLRMTVDNITAYYRGFPQNVAGEDFPHVIPAGHAIIKSNASDNK
jgi:D-lactate dehydrogenase